MAHLPPNVVETELSQKLQDAGLKLWSQGKVRDSYDLPEHPDMFLSIVTDRISAYDIVWPVLVPNKGFVVNAMNLFWEDRFFGRPEEIDFPTDLVTCGSGMDKYIPASLRHNQELYRRGSFRRRLEMLPAEFIARGYLTGSGWKAYKKDGKVCGIELPKGLQEGAELSPPIFTPSTKAQEGHDEHVDAAEIEQKYGLGAKTVRIYSEAREYAASRGIIIVDTKFEFGKLNDLTVLADEKLTPDSSRFWDAEAYRSCMAEGKLPPSLDKQFFRNHLGTVMTKFGPADTLDPLNTEHLAEAHNQQIDPSVVENTGEIYLDVYETLVGQDPVSFMHKWGVR